ncbi:MAG: hypothetical protein R8M46_02570 [Ghiorsea sp.]
MREYLLNVDMDLYGPYHSEEQAKFAQYLFISKHPDMAQQCEVILMDVGLDYEDMYEVRLLH